MTEVNGVSFHFPLVFQGRGDTGVGGENKKSRKSEKEKLLGGKSQLAIRNSLLIECLILLMMKFIKVLKKRKEFSQFSS